MPTYKILTEYIPSYIEKWTEQGYEIVSVDAGEDVPCITLMKDTNTKATTGYVTEKFVVAENAKPWIQQKLSEGYVIDGVGYGGETHVIAHPDNERSQEYEIFLGYNWSDTQNFINQKVSEGFILQKVDVGNYDQILTSMYRYK
jgi:hypothetical protein